MRVGSGAKVGVRVGVRLGAGVGVAVGPEVGCSVGVIASCEVTVGVTVRTSVEGAASETVRVCVSRDGVLAAEVAATARPIWAEGEGLRCGAAVSIWAGCADADTTVL